MVIPGLPPAQPFSQSVPAPQDAGVGQSMVDAWKFKMEQQKCVLQNARECRSKEMDKLDVLNQKLIEQNEKMSRLKIDDVSYDVMLEILGEAVAHISSCQEAWSKLIQFFLFVRNITRLCCEKQVPHFVRQVTLLRNGLERGETLSRNLKNQLFETVMRTSQSAFVAQRVSGTYCKISAEFFLPSLASLSKIVALEPGSTELSPMRQQLVEQAKKAQKAIEGEVAQQRKETAQVIDNRICCIEKDMLQLIGDSSDAGKRVAQAAAEGKKQELKAPEPDVTMGMSVDDLF